MKIIEITETKVDKMAEYAEEMLRYGGKLMQCIDALGSEDYGDRGGRYGDYGERGRYGNRGGSMNYRDDEDWDSDDMIGERRGRRRRDSRGRYM